MEVPLFFKTIAVTFKSTFKQSLKRAVLYLFSPILKIGKSIWWFFKKI